MNTFKVGFVIDPVHTLNRKKDSTLAMVRAALERQWEVMLFEMNQLFAGADGIYAKGYLVSSVNLSIEETTTNHDLKTTAFEPLPNWLVAQPQLCHLNQMQLILMRKDPPYNSAYHYCTQLLSQLSKEGVLISNNPRSLREFNEKLFILQFPELTPPTLVTSQLEQIKAFCNHHGAVVLKPLDAMGGSGIFKVQSTKDNLNVIVEMLTKYGQEPIMAQRFIPEITQGDKRILMIDGVPVPYVLARIPQGDDFRGNLAVGGKGNVQPITDSELAIAQAVGPVLKQNNIHFAGLDVIGDRLTEINITSPTCIREIEKETGLDIGGQLMDTLYTHSQT